MKINRKAFFAAIKGPLFGGRFTEEQVRGLDALIDAVDEAHVSNGWAANIFAQVYHETGRRMGPVREGFAKSDRGARQAVAKLYAAGKISRNYALPHANGNSYYGRGPIQITHGDNYKKLSPYVGVDLYADPDKALDPKIGAKIAVAGMVNGLFTGKGLAGYSGHDYFNMRDIVNGDKNKRDKSGEKIGNKIVRYSEEFAEALTYEKVDEPAKPAPVDKEDKPAHTPLTLWDRIKLWLGQFLPWLG